MNTFAEAATHALSLLAHADGELAAIVGLSLRVSVLAALIASAIGLPLGAWIAVTPFRGRRSVIVVLNALMGLPPVVAGLAIYLLLSRAGPLGALGLLFTPTAMVVAQVVLITPIVTALARQMVADGYEEYREPLQSLGASRARIVGTLLSDLRYSLFTVALAGFGRAAAEVGAVIIVGGNIRGFTRVMTTAIALETSKGDLPLALALGLILIAIVLAINAAAYAVRETAQRRLG